MQRLVVIIFLAFCTTFLASAQEAKPAAPPKVEAVLQDALDGNVKAQVTIGMMYERRGSYTNAVRWFQRAADQGSPDAEFKLGMAYAAGQGVLRDYVEAIRWFRLAAEKDLPIAQYDLGVAYEKGTGVQQDYQQAFIWYQRAATNHDFYAQKAVGVLCEKGLGTASDLAEAYKWYNLAAVRGMEEAVQLRDLLLKRMSPEQKQEGQKRFSQFVATQAKDSPTAFAVTPESTAKKTVAPPKRKVGDFLE